MNVRCEKYVKSWSGNLIIRDKVEDLEAVDLKGVGYYNMG